MSEIVRFGMSPETKPRTPKWAKAWFHSRPWYQDMKKYVIEALSQVSHKQMGGKITTAAIQTFADKNGIKELMVINHQVFLDIELTPEVTMFILQYESKK